MEAVMVGTMLIAMEVALTLIAFLDGLGTP